MRMQRRDRMSEVARGDDAAFRLLSSNNIELIEMQIGQRQAEPRLTESPNLLLELAWAFLVTRITIPCSAV
jgi:hypothetical protein